MLLLLFLPGCERELPSADLPAGEYVRALSDRFQSVEVNQILFGLDGKRPEPPVYAVEGILSQSASWGSAQDWNALASVVSTIAPHALARPDIVRLRLRAAAPDGTEWAYVDFYRHKLPAGWQDKSYLEQFSAAAVTAGTAQSGQALCDFYRAYQSAAPPADPGCKGH